MLLSTVSTTSRWSKQSLKQVASALVQLNTDNHKIGEIILKLKGKLSGYSVCLITTVEQRGISKCYRKRKSSCIYYFRKHILCVLSFV